MAAHCDIATGKIYGCKKGSFAWYHEMGHLKFNSEEKNSRLLLYKKYIFDNVLIFILFNIIVIAFLSSLFIETILIVALIVSVLIYFGIEYYEEFWCNIYANKKLNLKK